MIFKIILLVVTMVSVTYAEVSCGGKITLAANEEIIFRSPEDNTKKYPSDIGCFWKISAPSGYRIKFNTISFSLKWSSFCKYDSLRFTEFVGDKPKLLGSPFCGYTGPRNLESNTNTVIAYFETNKNTQYNGFNISARAIPVQCGGMIEVPANGQVIFQSPNHPFYYLPNAYCVYCITTLPGHRITFDAINFRSEKGCDILTFSETVRGYNVTIGSPFSGISGPINLQSNTNKVFAHFRTDYSMENIGFRISAKATPQLSTTTTTPFPTSTNIPGCLCQDTLVDVPVNGEVTFQSLNHPNNYPKYASCIYHFTTQPGYQLKFNSLFFHTERSYDSLKFYDIVDGRNVEMSNSSFSGNAGITNLQSSTNNVRAHFITDGSVEDSGFLISARVTPQVSTTVSTVVPSFNTESGVHEEICQGCADSMLIFLPIVIIILGILFLYIGCKCRHLCDCKTFFGVRSTTTTDNPSNQSTPTVREPVSNIALTASQRQGSLSRQVSVSLPTLPNALNHYGPGDCADPAYSAAELPPSYDVVISSLFVYKKVESNQYEAVLPAPPQYEDIERSLVVSQVAQSE